MRIIGSSRAPSASTLPRHLGTFRAFTRKVRDALRTFPERDVLYGPLMFYVGFRSAIVPGAEGRAARPELVLAR